MIGHLSLVVTISLSYPGSRWVTTIKLILSHVSSFCHVPWVSRFRLDRCKLVTDVVVMVMMIVVAEAALQRLPHSLGDGRAVNKRRVLPRRAH